MSSVVNAKSFTKEQQEAAVISVENGESNDAYSERVRKIEMRFRDWLWETHGSILTESVHKQVFLLACAAGGRDFATIEGYYKSVISTMKDFLAEQ